MGPGQRMDYLAALTALHRRRRDEVVVTTMTSTPAWGLISARPELDLDFGDCMGKASSLALGLALGRPRLGVWVLDGDGSLVMNLGTLVTIAQQAPPHLLHVVLENGGYEWTGGQPLPGAGRTDLVSLAGAAGYPTAARFDALAALEAGLDAVLAGPGPAFVALVVNPAGPLPRRPARPTRQALTELRTLLNELINPAIANIVAGRGAAADELRRIQGPRQTSIDRQ
jgi:thiamine pyrophosphate-dependent acetolactate synthase large subunit-like protein